MSGDERPLGAGLPRWQAAIALLLVGLFYLALPTRLRVGPPWLELLVVAVLVALVFVTRLRGYHNLTHWLGRIATGVVTLAVALSAVFLLTRLPGGKLPGSDLLQWSVLIWAANVLTFACWYWELDGGGPRMRRLGNYRRSHANFANN